MIIFFNYCFGFQPPLNYKNSKPNVIVIFTDDRGYSNIGVNQQVKDVKTPNIDKMASNGVTLKYGYCTAPEWAPSGAGLLPGQYQQKFGLDENGTIPLHLDEIIKELESELDDMEEPDEDDDVMEKFYSFYDEELDDEIVDRIVDEVLMRMRWQNSQD